MSTSPITQVRMWGRKCRTYEPMCPTCEAWALFESTGRVPALEEVEERIERSKALKEWGGM